MHHSEIARAMTGWGAIASVRRCLRHVRSTSNNCRDDAVPRTAEKCHFRTKCTAAKKLIRPHRRRGAYTTYEEARRTAAELSPKKGAQLNCRLCHPQNF